MEFLVIGFLLLVLIKMKKPSWNPKKGNSSGLPPYVPRSTPYAARLGRREAKRGPTDYGGDDWGW